MKDKKNFEKEAKRLLESKNKIRILKPDKRAMEKDFMEKWKAWKKENPQGTEWQFAREYMKKFLGV